MARPLRIERPGGRYHVTARANERKALFRGDADRFHFLKLLAESAERFGTKIHALPLQNRRRGGENNPPKANGGPTFPHHGPLTTLSRT